MHGTNCGRFRHASVRICMPNRFEKYTRAGTPRRAPLVARNRGPNGRRRFGSRAWPIRANRQTRGPCAGPIAEGRPANASNPGVRRVRTVQAGLPGPYRRPQHAMSQHGAVGPLFVWQGTWSRGLEPDPIRRDNQRNQRGEIANWRFRTVRAASSPCRDTQPFHEVGPGRIAVSAYPEPAGGGA